MSREERNEFSRNRKTNRNWCEWVRHNPIIVIENGTIRVFKLDDFKYFEPGRYPGLQRTKPPACVPECVPDKVRFDDVEGEMIRA